MAVLSTVDAEIYYEDLGAGDPVLLIHGAAASGRWFADFAPRLAEQHRVLMPDLRGLGRSPRVAPLARPEIWVEDLWRLLDSVGVDRVDVIGVSLGSRIAGRLVLDNRERIRSLVVDAPIIGLSGHGNTSLNKTFTEVDENSDQAREWRALHGEDWRDAVAFYAATRSAPGFQEYYTLRPHLGGIDVPTLICRGDYDDAVHPVDDATIWHREAPRTELWIAPGLTQSSTILERPSAFLDVLAGFEHRVRDAVVA